MIINCTPHVVDVYPPGTPTVVTDADYPYCSFEPSGQVARIAECVIRDVEPAPGVVGYTIVEYGHIADLPEPADGVRYIVSLPTALAARRRTDLLVPYRQVRNAKGTIVGCRGFAQPV